MGIAGAQAASFAPKLGETLLIVGQDRNSIADYVNGTGNVPGGTMVYTSVQKMDGLGGAADYGGGVQDASALAKAYPDSVIQVGLYMVGALNGVIAGQYDENVRFLASWIKRIDRPVFLRIGYEFDNASNRYDPEEYKAAFRHIVDVLREQGGEKVAFVWHSGSRNDSGRAWEEWYPGDDYVDWFGVSIFGTQQVPEAMQFAKLGRQHHKPLMIAESAPHGVYTVRGMTDWFTRIFWFIKANEVGAFSYINTDWDALPMFRNEKFGDQRIERFPEIQELWLKEIGKSKYLKASPDLFERLGWGR